MYDSLTSRVKRIVAGGAHAIVDAIEDAAPEAVMEQALREIDGAMDDVRAELGKVLAARHVATRRLADENGKHESLAQQIEVALQERRDDLAEAAIARQLDIEAQLPVLEQSIRDAGDSEKELEGYLRALGAKRREMAAELQAFREARARESAIQETAAGTATGDVAGRVARASGAFDRVLGRQTGLPPGATPDARTAGQLAELEDLARKNRIQERLAAAKAKIA